MRQSLVVEAAEKVLEGGAHAGGEHEHRRLAHHTADGQDAAGDDAVHGGGEHHGADHVPLAGPQAQGALPVALGHRLQGLLGGADDGGQGHDDQGEGAGQQGLAQVHDLTEDQHTHQGVQDRGDAGQSLGGELDGRDQLVVGGVLGEVDGGPHPQGQDEDQGDHDDIEGVLDGRHDAVGPPQDTLLAGEEGPVQIGQAPVEDVADEKEEQQAGDARGEIQQPAHPHLIGAAAGGEALGLVALGLFRGDHGVGHSSALLVPFQEYV